MQEREYFSNYEISKIKGILILPFQFIKSFFYYYSNKKISTNENLKNKNNFNYI